MVLAKHITNNFKGNEMTSHKAKPTVQIDNDLLRVTRWDFAPGTETGWHVHELNYVVVPVTNGTLTIDTRDGQMSMASLSIGNSYSRKIGTEHNVINNSDSDVAFIEIEIK